MVHRVDPPWSSGALEEVIARSRRKGAAWSLPSHPSRESEEDVIAEISLARVYDHPTTGERPTFLVERLWPRGVRREALAGAEWLKDVGPSTELRTWFGHDPEKWDEFRRRYVAELDQHPEVWQVLADAAEAGDITLLYSSRDTEHNNAVALRDYLLERSRRT